MDQSIHPVVPWIRHGIYRANGQNGDFSTPYEDCHLRPLRELKRDMSIKTNEALSKQKPRAIISTGDTGVARHVIDAGLLEAVIFENPLFERRSINMRAQKSWGIEWENARLQLHGIDGFRII